MRIAHDRRFLALCRRRSGRLIIRPGEAVFAFDEGGPAERLTIPFSRLRLEVGGANSVRFTLVDGSLPNVRVSTDEPEVIRSLADAGFHAAAEALRTARGRRVRRALRIAVPLAVAVGLLLGCPAFVTSMPTSWLDRLVSPERERRLTASLWSPGDRTCAHAADSTLEGRLWALAKIVADSSPRLTSLPLELCFDPEYGANAFAMPGGRITVTRGLLREARSTEELAGVLAHELAHVELRHPFRRFLERVGVRAGIALLASFAGVDATSWLGKGADVVSLTYSRSDERAADSRAVELLLDAGISPRGLAAFFERETGGRSAGGVDRALAFTRTHPLTADRLALLQSAPEPAKAMALPFTVEQLREPTAPR